MAKVKPGMRSSNVYSAENYRCQKCLEKGHFTYECTGKRKYVSRPNHTALLQKKLKTEEKEEAQSLIVSEQTGEASQPLNVLEHNIKPQLTKKREQKASSSSEHSDDDSTSESSESEDSESDSTSSNSSSSSKSSSSSTTSSSSSSTTSSSSSKSSANDDS